MIITSSMSFGYLITIIRSDDEGGLYYAEVADKDGKTVHTTDLTSASDAQAKAISWARLTHFDNKPNTPIS